MELSFTHKVYKPFRVRIGFPITLSITTQVPRVRDFTRTVRKVVDVHGMQQHAFATAKSAAGMLLSPLLRLATAPSADRSLFSTSTHNVCNALRGHRLLLCHSVKHYKTKVFCGFIYST